jgi:hypothetical protein
LIIREIKPFYGFVEDSSSWNLGEKLNLSEQKFNPKFLGHNWSWERQHVGFADDYQE